jgi:hypothetical protein
LNELETILKGGSKSELATQPLEPMLEYMRNFISVQSDGCGMKLRANADEQIGTSSLMSLKSPITIIEG